MSPRNFARRFAEEVGTTPAKYVERCRVEAARRKLEDSRMTVDRIAPLCGFGSTESMRTAFQRQLGVTPSDYRQRFASSSG